MSTELIMPKLGLTMTHGKVSKWLKKEGDRVTVGEVVVEIETDKINADVEAEVDGYILKIFVKEGEEKEITTPLCIIGERNENQGEAVKNKEINVGFLKPDRVFITPVARMIARENSLDYSGIKGSGPKERIVKKDILTYLKNNTQGSIERIKATPLARKMAAEVGIDYTKLKGTGPDGRIVKDDILAAVEDGKRICAFPAAVTENFQPQVEDNSKTALVKIPEQSAAGNISKKVPLSGIRKIVAKRLAQSKHDIPHVYFKISVEVDALMDLKNKVAEAVRGKTGKKPSLNDWIIKATAVALAEFPDFNVSLINDEIVYYNDVNIGVAVNSEKGLVVPVIKGVNKKSLSELCKSSGELIDRARNGKALPDDMTGGTFTISSLGAYQIDEFCAIINPPESAILAVGKAAETPVARNGEVVVRTIMCLTISVDHRVIDGALAAQFMKRLKDLLENPYSILI